MLCSCAGRQAGRNGSGPSAPESSAPSAGRFVPSLPSETVPPESRRAFIRDHFWDGFRFADSAYVASQDSLAMLRCFAVYVMQAGEPFDLSPVEGLMRKAGAHRHTFRYFLNLAGMVLHDPNSPLRNDELYIPVLEAAVASPLLDEYEKAAPAYDLGMARRNRVGHAASDFAWTTLDGGAGRLYGLHADYTLIFFSNPGCPMCHDIQMALSSSPLVEEMVASGRLAVVMFYPDDDIEAWRTYADGIPAGWIYARDREQTVRTGSLYDLRAIPSLYLLDSDKRVILKDASDVFPIENVLAASAGCR